MEILIIATGKCKNKAILSLEAEYLKRLKVHYKLKIIELNHSQSTRPEDIKKDEAIAQLNKISSRAFIIALDERGKSIPTLEFAKIIKHEQDTGCKTICFIIGGAEGLDETIRNKANLVLSLSRLTFPHQMVRPIIIEQLYRAASVNSGHPYHRQ